MVFLNKKIRRLMELLEKKKLPRDLKEVTDAISKAAPTPNAKFQKDLRKKLLLKHQELTAQAAVQKKVSEEKASDSVLESYDEPSENRFIFKNLFSFKGFASALVIILVLAISGVATYPLIPAPQVEGYSLKESVRKISYNAPIKIVFNQPMDQRSVEKAFSIEPKVPGKFSWVNNALLFTPEKPFEVGQVFKVSLNQNAKSLFQKNLPYEYVENFQIIASPQVLLFSPAAGSKEVAIDSTITVHFDRPMVALTTLDQGMANAPNIEIEPKTNGQFKWLGTDTIQFIPDTLTNATLYTVKIPKGTASADGGKTDTDFVYKFETLKPQFVSSNPRPLSIYNGPDTQIKITFNQIMDINQAASKVHLYRYKGDNRSSQREIYDLVGDVYLPSELLKENLDFSKFEEIPLSASYYTVEEYKKDNNIIDAKEDSSETEKDAIALEEPIIPEIHELQKTLVFTPSIKLPYDSYFVVKIDKDFKGIEGSFTLEKEEQYSFKTAGALKAYTKETNFTNLPGSPEIHFTQPMDEASLQEHIVLEPLSVDADTKEPGKVGVSMVGEKVSLWVSHAYKPSTSYTLTIKKGAKSLFGNTLQEDLVVKFTTAPLAPEFNVLTTGSLSIVDASQPQVFFVKTTNLDFVNVNFKKISEQEFENFFQGGWINMENSSVEGLLASWKVNIQNKANETVLSTIDFTKQLGSKLEPGFYYFDVSHPKIFAYENKIRVDKYLFAVTNNGLASKVSRESLLVWATSFEKGEPVSNMDVVVKSLTPHEDNNRTEWKELFTGKTDQNGLVGFKLNKENQNDAYNLLIYGKGQNGESTVTYTNWGEGVQPHNFQIEHSPEYGSYYGYIYTDRPIYRPGHTVYFKGLLRKQKDAVFSLPDFKKVHAEIYDSRGDKVVDKDFDLNNNSTFNGEFVLSEQARTGNYYISLSFPESKEEYISTFTQNFMVSEYRKPDYELKVENDKPSYIQGEKAVIKVKASYFFGAPMPNAPIYWSVTGQDYFFFLGPESKSKYASEWYSFSNEGYTCYFGCDGDSNVITQGKAKTDQNGEFTIELPLDIAQKKMSQLYTVNVSAVDVNNQSVSNRVSFPVHQGEFYAGIMNKDYVVEEGKDAVFKVISVDERGNPVGNKTMDVTFAKRKWNTIKKKNVDGDFYYENSYDDTVLEKKSVTTNAEGYAEVSFHPKEGGSFNASVSTKDGRGNIITASTNLYVTSSTFVNWGRENNDRIELIPDKLEYKPGDTAHILVKSPYQNVHALITTERNDILSQKVVRLTSNAETIDIPITEKSLPNIFVSVLLVKGNMNVAGLKEPAKDQIDERDIAAFKLGYTTLQVNNSSKKLTIDVKPNASEYHPRDEVSLKIKATDINEKPAQAEISIAVVDKSVLSLTENFTADLLNEFYRKRALGVLTGDSRTKLLSRINVQVQAGGKGGGGGDIQTRGEFKDTAFWQAVVNTNAKGEGEVKFKLPDNLTTWQVLAIGITPDTLVGSQKTEFTVNQDVIVRPVLPRFLIVNDEMKVGAVVHNYLKAPMDFTVNMKASGVDMGNMTSQTIHLNPGEEKKVEFAVTVKNQKQAEFTFTAQSSTDINIGDSVKTVLPIQVFSYPEVVATSAVITDDAKHVETVWLPNNIDKNFGELIISVAPSLMGPITQGLEYLVQFPYSGVEQISSALLPNLVLKEMSSLPNLGEAVKKQVDMAKVDKSIVKGLQTLYKAQQPNGSFGFWTDSEPNAYLTAYVLQTLAAAEKNNYTVDARVKQSAIDYLRSYLNSSQVISEREKSATLNSADLQRQKMSNLNARAFILYVLSEIGQGDLGLNNNLYTSSRSLNLYAKTYLAMSYDLLLKQQNLDEAVQKDIETKITALKNQILNGAQESPRGVHFEEDQLDYAHFDTNARTTALVLQMLTRVDKNNPLIPKILRYMLMERHDGHFASTQETAVALMAFTDYLKVSQELEANFTARVQVNSSKKIEKAFSGQNIFGNETVTMPVSELLLNNQDNEIIADKDGTGRLYFDMNLKYYLPVEKIEARNEGITVRQEYFAISDEKEKTPLKTLTMGENFKAKITVVVPKDMHYVMVEDFLPAGLEGIDFNLKTSEQSLNHECYEWDCQRKSWNFHYSEVRDDRVMHFADFLPKGVYEIEYYVRATTPGTFHDLPTMAQETYFPEVFGRSEGRILEIRE